MNVKKILGLACAFVLLAPVLASAEIYKWKDKNGVVRYSDTPPLSTVKVQTLSSTGTSRQVNRPVQEEQAETTAPAAKSQTFNEDRLDPEEEAARVRARNAETEQRNKVEKEKMAKLNLENCKAARANYRTFQQGGRIYKVNEKGEKDFYGKQGIAEEKAKAQADIDKYCK